MKDWSEYYQQVTAALKQTLQALTEGKDETRPLDDLLVAVIALRSNRGLPK